LKFAPLIVSTLLFLLSSFAAFANDDVLWKLDVKDGKPSNCKLNWTKLLKDAKGIECFNADTEKSPSPWNTCIDIAPGLLKAGQDYVVTFDYEIFDRPTEATYFYVFARSEKLGYGADKWTKWNDASGAHGTATLRISPKSNDYGIYVGIHTKGAMRVENLCILQGNGFAEANLNGIKEEAEPPPIITGAKPFVVDAPNNPEGAILNLADFNCEIDSPQASSETKEDRNRNALKAALNECRKVGAAKLTLPKGVYRITSGRTLEFKDLHDFVFDGNGSTFLFDKISGGNGISISNCNRTVFRNFNLDWDWNKDPLASIGRLTKLAPDKSYFEMRFEKDVPFEPKRWVTMLELDENLMVPGPGPEFGNFGPKKVERVDANTVRVYPSYPLSTNVGKLYLLRHYVYDKEGITMGDNTHMSMQNVTIFSFPGLAFVTGGAQHHCEFLHCRITFPPNERRPITTTADGFHVAHSKGFIKLEDCDFGYMGDDCVNIHDVFQRGVTRANDYTLVLNNIVSWRCPFAVGDPVELRNADFSPAKFEANVTEMKSDSDAKTLTLVLDKELPSQIDTQSMVFNRHYGGDNYIIRNCYFHENRARGMLLKSANNMVEGNRFYHNQHAAMMLTLDTDSNWSEGYGPSNIVIRNNKFDSPNCRGTADGAAVYLRATVNGKPEKYEAVKNILFENNSWNETTGPAIEAASFNKLVVSNNTITNRNRPYNECKMRGCIVAEEGKGLWVNGNTWNTKTNVQNPSVFYDASTVRQVFCSDNQLQ